MSPAWCFSSGPPISPGRLEHRPVRTPSARQAYRSGCILPCMMVIPFSGASRRQQLVPVRRLRGRCSVRGRRQRESAQIHRRIQWNPAEQVGGGFPAVVSDGNVLSSPVYDSASGLVFVGSGGESVANTNGNRLHSVIALNGVVTDSQGIGTTSLRTGVRDAPIVDSTAKRVYAFIGADKAGRTRWA